MYTLSTTIFSLFNCLSLLRLDTIYNGREKSTNGASPDQFGFGVRPHLERPGRTKYTHTQTHTIRKGKGIFGKGGRIHNTSGYWVLAMEFLLEYPP